MKTIFADYNAMTESEHLRLNCRGSQEDIEQAGLRPGDWAWFSDGEVIVGGQLRNDPYWGLLGIPDWRTLVPLDEEGANDPARILLELEPLLRMADLSADDKARIFQLVTQLEHADPTQARSAQWSVAARRADALVDMGSPGLALLEIEEARRDPLRDPVVDLLFLEVLRRTAPERAVAEAESLAGSPNVPADVQVAAINVLAEHAEGAPDHEFAPLARRALELCAQFERTHGRGDISASLLSMVHFNRGMLLLRMDQGAEAHRALELAHQLDPLDPVLNEATRLVAYDQRARELGSRVRSRSLAA